MQNNNQPHNAASTTTRARPADAMRKSPPPAGVVAPLDPTGLELDDEAFERSLSTTLPEIEKDIEGELGASAPLVMMIALAGAAGLGPKPIDLRISSPSEFALQQLVWASHQITGGLVMGGKILAEEPSADAPLQVELLRRGQSPLPIRRNGLNETSSRLFLQVSEEPPFAVKGLYDLRIDASGMQAHCLQQWLADNERQSKKEDGSPEGVPLNLWKGLLNAGLMAQNPLIPEAVDCALSRTAKDISDEMTAHVRRFTVAAFYMLGSYGVDAFLAGQMDIFHDVSSLLGRVDALTK